MFYVHAFFIVAISELSFEAVTDVLHLYNGSVQHGCPEWDALPRVKNSKFIGITMPLVHLYLCLKLSGARYYTERGHDIPALSCNGRYYEANQWSST